MNYPFNNHITFIIIIKPTRKWRSSFLIFGGKQSGGLIFLSEWDPLFPHGFFNAGHLSTDVT